MWTANIDTIAKDGSNVNIQVTYTSSVSGEIIRESYKFESPIMLKQTIKNKIKQLTNLDDFINTTTTGTPDLSDPIIEPPPVPIKTAKELFLEDWRKLTNLMKAVDLGIVDNTATIVINLKNKVKTDFKPEYIDALF